MFRFLSAALVLLLALSGTCGTDDVIRTTRELSHALLMETGLGRPYALDGVRVILPYSSKSSVFVVEDETGAVVMNCGQVPGIPESRAGDVISVTGTICGKIREGFYADCKIPKLLRHDPPVNPVDVTAADLKDNRYDNRLVRISGTVRDILDDEIDPRFLYLVITCDGSNIYAAESRTRLSGELPRIGAKVSVCGIWAAPTCGNRRQIGRYVRSCGITVLDTAENTDLFAVPPLQPFRDRSPDEIATLGRHSTSGLVLAAWHNDTALLKTEAGRMVRIELSEPNCPRPGDFIQAVGFPESDLYRINLTRAIWRPVGKMGIDDPRPVDATVESLQTCVSGRRTFDPRMHGIAIRIRGTVRNLSSAENDKGRFEIESEGFTIPVDVSMVPSAADGLSVGCTIEIAGTCVMETENWRPNAAFPQIKRFSVVLRDADGIRILRRPPWWTTRRLLMVIGTLVIALVAFLVWNTLLRKLVEKKGRELYRAQIEKTGADMRTEERTRLAVELHDSISQNLTGVSMQIDAAGRLIDKDRVKTLKCLDLASRTLDSCRTELRNCIWDLRNQTIDERDMNEAIRRTVQHHVGSSELSIRFNVPRRKLSDNTSYALMRIIRELATNAVRHGHAKSVRIAGAIENGRLLFSVTDDGCGFDPESRPGIADGHFGIQGIAERIKPFRGTMDIESAPGKGTRVCISLEC